MADEVKVKDTKLYDVLGVPPTATGHEISVAYRRKREQVWVRDWRRPFPAAHLPLAAEPVWRAVYPHQCARLLLQSDEEAESSQSVELSPPQPLPLRR